MTNDSDVASRQDLFDLECIEPEITLTCYTVKYYPEHTNTMCPLNKCTVVNQYLQGFMERQNYDR